MLLSSRLSSVGQFGFNEISEKPALAWTSTDHTNRAFTNKKTPHTQIDHPMTEKSDVERITTLEEKYAHLERIAADLNDVIIDQQKRIIKLETLLHRADEKIDQLHAALDQPRSAVDERPPHY
ncbi:hypothetical protein DTL21_03185 [Bremerella cremea]|uniref:SlyX protein n=2 Tax=Pirellulales TaxID=2691354 RepID=A0A2S8G5S7_9BACT|nr:hypothetical protein C5Y83_03185 [Blastopirellula marina]RCS51230.1 hypothetical protein DTL21_03185 [Bremerella cremea]